MAYLFEPQGVYSEVDVCEVDLPPELFMAIFGAR